PDVVGFYRLSGSASSELVLQRTGRAVSHLPKDNSESDRSRFFAVVVRDCTFHLANVVENPNFAASEFCMRTGVADCILFGRVSGPVRAGRRNPHNTSSRRDVAALQRLLAAVARD